MRCRKAEPFSWDTLVIICYYTRLAPAKPGPAMQGKFFRKRGAGATRIVEKQKDWPTLWLPGDSDTLVTHMICGVSRVDANREAARVLAVLPELPHGPVCRFDVTPI